MYKVFIWGIAVLIFFSVMSCQEDSQDPPEFTNGLLISIGQNPANNGGIESTKKFTARSNVECSRQVYPGSDVYTFKAETSSDDKFSVKFKWVPDKDDSLIYISESGYNEIELISSDPEIGTYYINSSSDQADETLIKLIEIENDVIIEAEIEGFIYKSGSPTVPDTLKNGYFITKNFVLPDKE